MQNQDNRQPENAPEISFKTLLRTLLLPPDLKRHRTEWNRDNMDALWLICFGGMAVGIFGIVLSLTNKEHYRLATYVIALCAMCAVLISLKVFRKPISRHPLAAIYIVSSLVLTADIILETSMQKGAMFIFCILMTSLPVCFVDYPLRILMYETVFSIIFMIVDMNRRYGLLLELDRLRIIMSLVSSFILYTFVIQRRNKLTETAIGTRETASRDALTGILNRGAGERQISSLVERGIPGTFLLMDIDDFKHINDHYGHERGDEVLQAVAAVLAASFRSTDVVMRMGGDEFMAYAPGLLDMQYVQKRMGELRSAMHDIVMDEETGDSVSISAGVLINKGKYLSYEGLYTAADKLLYQTKLKGKDGCTIE